MSNETPSQTVGPFFAFALCPTAGGIAGSTLSTDGTEGRRIRVEGRVLDGQGEPIPDAMVEVWQANARGRYLHPADERKEIPLDPHFRGFGRAGTDGAGRFHFDTIMPGRVPGPGASLQAPHINVVVFARGLLVHAYTRIYFDDEAEANAADPVLGLVDVLRRKTLVARRLEAAEPSLYRFDIHMQGDEETVFFDV